MVKLFGSDAAACPRCGRKRGAGERHCAGCGLVAGAPRHAPVLVENRWMPGPDELAVFFGMRALSGVFVKTLRVPATARAYVLQGERATEVPQGEYELEGFFTRLNHLLRDQHAEILVTRTGALPVDVELGGLPTAEHLQVDARVRLSLRIENVPAFARHFMTLPGTIGADQLRELLAAPLRQLAADFTCARSLRDMAGRGALRAELDQHLQGGLAMLLAEHGLAVVRVDTLELRHDKYDAHRARVGTLWLAADAQHADAEHRLAESKRLDALYDAREWQRIEGEAAAARRRHRGAELKQEESLARAELSLDNAERAHRLRAREIELYGRILESRTRKDAIARGAGETVAELEHELGKKRAARGDEAAEWEHLRALAGIRMKGEMEVAEQDALDARTVARQRFAQQLLQQQIRNKIEQAKDIEDAARRREELARLHEAQGALARRAKEIEDEEHAGRLRLLELANAARRREAERLLEWDDAVAAARLGERALAAERDAEALRQQAAGLRRQGAAADSVAQHDKLLRTIEADRAARAIDADERAADRDHELRRVTVQQDHELARVQAFGALDDGARLALAPVPNAALLAEVMKARVHAGMDAAQLHGLAAVAGAGQVTPEEAQRMARAQVDEERVRREREVDKDRRHQLDLLAMQNDVNKAALAGQAQRGAAAPTVNVNVGACRHADAAPGDRYCGTCGAALPAGG